MPIDRFLDNLGGRLATRLKGPESKASNRITLLSQGMMISGYPLPSKAFLELVGKIYELDNGAVHQLESLLAPLTPSGEPAIFIHLLNAQIIMGAGVVVNMPPDVPLRVRLDMVVGFLPGYLATGEQPPAPAPEGEAP
jgi:hypothetical protein